jgi:hypothetical protein
MLGRYSHDGCLLDLLTWTLVTAETLGTDGPDGIVVLYNEPAPG